MTFAAFFSSCAPEISGAPEHAQKRFVRPDEKKAIDSSVSMKNPKNSFQC